MNTHSIEFLLNFWLRSHNTVHGVQIRHGTNIQRGPCDWASNQQLFFFIDARLSIPDVWDIEASFFLCNTSLYISNYKVRNRVGHGFIHGRLGRDMSSVTTALRYVNQ